MFEVTGKGSDERGFYASDTGEARDEMACGWDGEGKKAQKGSNVVMVKKVIDEGECEGTEQREKV